MNSRHVQKQGRKNTNPKHRKENLFQRKWENTLSSYKANMGYFMSNNYSELRDCRVYFQQTVLWVRRIILCPFYSRIYLSLLRGIRENWEFHVSALNENDSFYKRWSGVIVFSRVTLKWRMQVAFWKQYAYKSDSCLQLEMTWKSL